MKNQANPHHAKARKREGKPIIKYQKKAINEKQTNHRMNAHPGYLNSLRILRGLAGEEDSREGASAKVKVSAVV